jgi:hypothetical protein
MKFGIFILYLTKYFVLKLPEYLVFIYLFMVYLTSLSIAQNRNGRMINE